MQDLQRDPDRRGIPLQKAGVRGLKMPAHCAGQATVLEADLSVSVPADQRGTHMSRFVECLVEEKDRIEATSIDAFHALVRGRLEAEEAQLTLRFPYFIDRAAPVSGASAPFDVEVALHAEGGVTPRTFIELQVAITSLCPCSKAISDYGAHNQRGTVSIKVRFSGAAPRIEDLVAIAEASASAPLYPLLKRPDERHVTMQAYDNPAFVEDIARGVAEGLQNDSRVLAFEVEVVNAESIHNHDAFAEVRWER